MIGGVSYLTLHAIWKLVHHGPGRGSAGIRGKFTAVGAQPLYDIRVSTVGCTSAGMFAFFLSERIPVLPQPLQNLNLTASSHVSEYVAPCASPTATACTQPHEYLQPPTVGRQVAEAISWSSFFPSFAAPRQQKQEMCPQTREGL